MSAQGPGTTYIGIDLGTTNSAVAYLDQHGRPCTIPNAEGQLTTPSVILMEPGGEVIVGREAKQAALAEPDRVAEAVKRDMGERYYRRPVNGKQVSPQALSALILKKLKQDAEHRIGPVAGAVITVPAYFDEGRRQATVAAAEIAGLRVVDIVNEPTAAALAYAFHGILDQGRGGDEALRLVEETHRPRITVIYDLGGGTFDVTVLKITGRDLTVMATDGDVYLGGRDWDERIVNEVCTQFVQQHGQDPREDPMSLQHIVSLAEQAKINLSRRNSTRLAINHAGQSLTIELTRRRFEELTGDLLYRTQSRLGRVIGAAGLAWSQVDEVLTVGGSTRMPQVLEMLERTAGKRPNTSLSPDEVVAHGAAIHAAIHVLQSSPQTEPQRRALTPSWARTGPGKPQRSSESTPLGLPAIPGESRQRLGDSQALTPHPGALVPGPENEEIILLDEQDPTPGVAEGDETLASTAILPTPDVDEDLGAVLKSIRTSNVNAHSLGVMMRQLNGTRINSIIIPRNTKLPTSVTRRYGTVVPDQRAVTVVVVEGESQNVEDCIPIAACRVEPLPPGLPKGSTIYVTFSYDNSGRLDVKAVEATSGSSANTTVQRTNAMDALDFDRIRKAVSKLKVN